MAERSLQASVAGWLDELREKQSTLRNVYRLGDYERFDRDGEAGVIRFSTSGESKVLVATTTDIGSYSIVQQTWMRAWANESTPEGSRRRAARIRELLAPLDVAIVRDAHFEADEELAWELAAVSVHHLGSLGCYRGPSGSLLLFLAIDELQVV